MKEESPEQPDPIEFDPIETKPETKQSLTSGLVIKLVLLIVLLVALIKYGVPLMNTISEQGKNFTEKKKQSEPELEGETDVKSAVFEDAFSHVRITKGYEGWLPEVQTQLGEWVGEGTKYKLLSVLFHDSKKDMEIRYTTQDAEGFAENITLVLKQDGFDGRFIVKDEQKEFIVYPPSK